MQLFCAKCQAAFSASASCPRCGSRLMAPQEAHVLPSDRSIALAPPIIHTTAIGRMAVGTLVCLGSLIGMIEVVNGLLPYLDLDEAWWTGDLAGWLVLALRATAAIAGGLVAGAGREKAWITGLSTGLISAIIVVIAMRYLPVKIQEIPGYLSAVLMPVLAASAGMIGGRIWPSTVGLPSAKGLSRGSSLLEMAKEQEEDRRLPPMSWLRVILGVSLAVMSFVVAEPVRNGIAKHGGELFNLGGARNVPMNCLQIAGFGIALAGIAAGAGTNAGWRQGTAAGILTAAVLVGLYYMHGPLKFPAVAGLYEALGLRESMVATTRGSGTLFVATSVTTLACSLFGAILFPVVVERKRPRVGPSF